MFWLHCYVGPDFIKREKCACGNLQIHGKLIVLLSFKEPQVAFEGIDATELYPCVLFYSNIFGEKVISFWIVFCDSERFYSKSDLFQFSLSFFFF